MLDQEAGIPPIKRGATPEGTACKCCFLLPHCLHRLSVTETSPGFGISKGHIQRVSSVHEAHVCIVDTYKPMSAAEIMQGPQSARGASEQEPTSASS